MKNKNLWFVFIFYYFDKRCYEGSEIINLVVIVSIFLFNNKNSKCIISDMIDWCIINYL